MRKNIEETLHFYISNEINSFNQSSLSSKLFDLVNQLGFHIECSFGCGDNNSKNIYFSFLVVDNNGEGVTAGEYDEFVRLNAATRIIAIDKKDKIKFYSWEEDDDFIESINWVVKELEKKVINKEERLHSNVHPLFLITHEREQVWKWVGIDITENMSYNNSVAKLNPFRYRGYYYDAESGLYYLNSRYYDPSIGRFINADDISYIQPTDINGLNLFAYCGNNPVMYTDPTGNFILISFLIGLGIAAGIGAGIGAVSYIGSEVVSWAITGEWNWSWGMFAGSILGGAIGGALSYAVPLLGITGAAFVNGFISNAIGMGLQNAWEGTNYSVADILFESIFVGGFSALTAGITNKIKIKGFTGRGSISQVTRQIYTKFFNGTIKRVTASTLCKMVVYEAAYSIFNTFVNILMNVGEHYRKYKKWGPWKPSI